MAQQVAETTFLQWQIGSPADDAEAPDEIFGETLPRLM
jgi:hypothetical protein